MNMQDCQFILLAALETHGKPQGDNKCTLLISEILPAVGNSEMTAETFSEIILAAADATLVTLSKGVTAKSVVTLTNAGFEVLREERAIRDANTASATSGPIQTDLGGVFCVPLTVADLQLLGACVDARKVYYTKAAERARIAREVEKSAMAKGMVATLAELGKKLAE